MNELIGKDVILTLEENISVRGKVIDIDASSQVMKIDSIVEKMERMKLYIPLNRIIIIAIDE